jgi:hypothetical protein
MTFTESKNQQIEAYVSVHLIRAPSVSHIKYIDILENVDLDDGFGRFYPQIGPTYHPKEIRFTAVLHRKL